MRQRELMRCTALTSIVAVPRACDRRQRLGARTAYTTNENTPNTDDQTHLAPSLAEALREVGAERLQRHGLQAICEQTGDVEVV